MRHPRRTLAFALGAVFTALVVYALALPKAEESVRPVDKARFLAAEQAMLKRGLPDPASAQFRNLIVSTARPTPFACGEINARGPAGGYTDFLRFVSGPTLRLIEPQPHSPDMDRIWAEFCRPDRENP